MTDTEKPQITQMNADIKYWSEPICVYLRYLRSVLDQENHD